MQSSIFLGPVEKALNRYLTLDPESQKRLSALEGKNITIALKPFTIIFQLHIENGRIQLLAEESYPAQIKITGTPLSLLGLTLSSDKKHHFFSDDLVIEGSTDEGQQVIDLFDKLEIDWEEQLSKLIGDLPAHEVGSFIKKIKNWGRQSTEILIKNIDEYIHEEQAWTPPAEALNDFYHEVDELRMTADRLEAKIRNL
jgi:ubiquinone biosynthesis accessory factor UbiJ